MFRFLKTWRSESRLVQLPASLPIGESNYPPPPTWTPEGGLLLDPRWEREHLHKQKANLAKLRIERAKRKKA